MKIAILTSGTLPVPAAKGGAVENLVDFYLEYNEKHALHDVTVFSVTDRHYPIAPEKLHEKHNHYVQFNTDKFCYRMGRKLYSYTTHNPYYNYLIDYYLHKTLAMMKKDSFDLVILENRPGFAAYVKEALNVPIVLHLHNDLLNGDTFHGDELSKALDGVICVSDYIKGRVEIVCSPNICKTVHNGIDTSKFSRTDDNAELRRQLQLDNDDYVVIYSGRLIREKGVKELIEAIALIDDPKVKLVIMGASFFAGSDTVDSYVEELKQVALPLKDRIVFTGYIDYECVPSYLSMADVAVIPSLWDDPFPTTCLEAMAIGLPIVACKSGGIPEMVGEPNILIERGEGVSQRIAEAIVRMKEYPISPQPLQSCYDKEVFSANFWKTIKEFIV